MDEGNVTPINHGGGMIFGRPKMGENIVTHGIVLRYSIVVVCSDYVVKNTNINKREMNRQKLALIYVLRCNHS